MTDRVGYPYIWEYRVEPAHVDEFVAAYGPEGDWAELFRKHAGYIGTELLRDRESPDRFVTINSWTDRESWAAFRGEAREAFDALDARCERFTRSERQLGEFTPVR